jgi:hypothetical protein
VNLRFTTSFPELVRDLVGLGRDLTLVNRSDFYGERYPFGTLVPLRRHGELHRRRDRLGARALEQVEQGKRRHREQRRDDDGETREVPLHDVLTSL